MQWKDISNAGGWAAASNYARAKPRRSRKDREAWVVAGHWAIQVGETFYELLVTRKTLFGKLFRSDITKLKVTHFPKHPFKGNRWKMWKKSYTNWISHWITLS